MALSWEENETLTRVGPGTPGGEMLRRYWQPIALSRELKNRPIKRRLLGEDLVLFRTESGELGLVGNRCLHRPLPAFHQFCPFIFFHGRGERPVHLPLLLYLFHIFPVTNRQAG